MAKNTKIGRSTAEKLPKIPKKKKEKKTLPPGDPRLENLKKGVPFKKGFDERRNLDGPPRDIDYLKKTIQDIFEEAVDNQATGEKVKMLRAMILKMVFSNAAADHVALLQYGFGKVPDEIVFTMDDLKKVIEYLPDDMIQLLAKGENITDVLITFIKSHSDGARFD